MTRRAILWIAFSLAAFTPSSSARSPNASQANAGTNAATKTTLNAKVPSLKMEALPAELALDPGQPAKGRLVIVAHNPDGGVLGSASLTVLTPTGITAAISGKPATLLGDLSWGVDLYANEIAASPAKLAFTLTYTSVDGGPSAIASVNETITIPPPISASALKPTLLPSEGSVEEDAPLNVVLQIDNPTRQAAIISHIRLIGPPHGVKLCDPQSDEKAATKCDESIPSVSRIEPGRTLVLPLLLAAASSLPGNYPLVIGFDAKLDGMPAAQLLNVQGKLGVEIKGVSEALQLVGIPSLLLLPGVLAILTGSATWGMFKQQKTLDLRQIPMLLVAAVTLSFGAALLYPLITQELLHDRRDYLRGYSMRDVAYVWGGSMGVGAVVAFVAGVSRVVAQKVKRWWRRLLPSSTDDPIDVLRKLSDHHAGFMLQAWQAVDAGANEQFMLALPFGDAGAGNRWLVQRAEIRQAQQAGTAGRVARIRAALEETEPLAIVRLLKEVQDGAKAGEVTINWERDAGLGPQALPTSKYRPANGVRSFIVLTDG